jgi:hypothetical protein
MFSNYSKDERTDRERYLEDELERERDAARERERIEDERREQRQREREEMRAYEARQADTWPEALRKDLNLLRREIDPEYEASDGDWFFTDAAAATERALEIWDEHEKAHYARIEELHRLIEQEKEAIKQGVASQLEKETPLRTIKGEEKQNYGWNTIVQSLRDFDDPSELLNW